LHCTLINSFFIATAASYWIAATPIRLSVSPESFIGMLVNSNMEMQGILELSLYG